MAKEMNSFDISGSPELMRMAEEVNKAGKPYVLKEHNRKLAMITPLTSARKRKAKREKAPDYESLRAAAGSWSDVDTDAFLKDIYASRSISTRPPVEL